MWFQTRRYYKVFLIFFFITQDKFGRGSPKNNVYQIVLKYDEQVLTRRVLKCFHLVAMATKIQHGIEMFEQH